jgi:hypothetical protein
VGVEVEAASVNSLAINYLSVLQGVVLQGVVLQGAVLRCGAVRCGADCCGPYLRLCRAGHGAWSAVSGTRLFLTPSAPDPYGRNRKPPPAGQTKHVRQLTVSTPRGTPPRNRGPSESTARSSTYNRKNLALRTFGLIMRFLGIGRALRGETGLRF